MWDEELRKTLNTIKFLKTIYKSKKANINSFNDLYKSNVTRFLENGTYTYKAFPIPMLTKDNVDVKKFINKGVSNSSSIHGGNKYLKYSIKKIISFFISTKVFITSKKNIKDFQGQIILFKSLNNSIKIIDLNKSLILIYYVSKAELQKTLKVIYSLGNHLNHAIVETNEEKKYIIEKYIDFDPIDSLSINQVKKTLEKYFSDLLILFENINTSNSIMINNSDYLRFYLNYLSLDSLYNLNLTKLLASLNEIVFIDIKSDNGLNNFLIKGNDYYLIDFEGKSYHSFINLLTTYQWSLSKRYNWNEFLRYFKQGYYNDLLERAFTIFGFNFDNSILDSYFFLSILNYEFYDLNKNKNLEEINKLDRKLAMAILSNYQFYMDI